MRYLAIRLLYDKNDKKIDKTNENTVATDYYKQFAQGIIFDKGTSVEKTRKVLTTRQDNTIHIAVNSEDFYITTNAFGDDIDNYIENLK